MACWLDLIGRIRDNEKKREEREKRAKNKKRSASLSTFLSFTPEKPEYNLEGDRREEKERGDEKKE